MLHNIPAERIHTLPPHEISDALEGGQIVHFPQSPVPFPAEADLRFLRDELPDHLRRKNISYHPEAGRVIGVGGPAVVQERARRVLEEHSRAVRSFLERAVPSLARNWTVATSSFRPIQEKGRALSRHASNERVHVDAKAYGATHGNRILRFFMNAHPSEDRVWVSKGAFPEVYRKHAAAAGLQPPDGRGHELHEGWGDRAFNGIVGALGAVFPLARMLETSPYDRLMRRFHNYMKDDEAFQRTPEGHQDLAFKPGAAWMVFTDMVTHACLSGRHAFIDTFIVPLENCRRPELAPYNLLRSFPGSPGN